jgi:hypothetical protein
LKQLISPKELATAIGVSESSMKRWADDGLVQATRTVGGHRRIALPEAVRFIRQIGATVVRPEVLGLNDLAAIPAESAASGAAALYSALERGDTIVVRGLIQSMYLSGMGLAAMCDGPLRESMVRIGELWLHQEWGIAVEHRATDIIIQSLNQLRALQPAPLDTAPVAVGCAGPDDPYLLPSLMCAAVAGELGYRDVNLGPRTPLSVLRHAVEHYRPALVWVTVSIAPDPERLLAELRLIAKDLSTAGIPLVVGGRAVANARPGELVGMELAHSMAVLESAGKRRLSTLATRAKAVDARVE